MSYLFLAGFFLLIILVIYFSYRGANLFMVTILFIIGTYLLLNLFLNSLELSVRNAKEEPIMRILGK
jgi:hypothetical protein